MLDTFAFGWLRAVISGWSRPRVLPEDLDDKLRARERPIVYVLEVGGLADSTVLEKICRERGWMRPSQPLPFAPYGLKSVICLERRRGFLGNRIDRRIPSTLRMLVRGVLSHDNGDIDFVPALFKQEAYGSAYQLPVADHQKFFACKILACAV